MSTGADKPVTRPIERQRQRSRQFAYVRQQPCLEGRGIHAGQCAQFQAALFEQVEVGASMPRAEHRGVALFRDARRRGLQQHHASPGRQVSRHPLHGVAQRSGVENVLQHRDAEDEIELLASIELRQILNQKTATIADAVCFGAALALHRSWWDSSPCPVTCAPRFASSELQRPTPQPTSSTREPGFTSSHGSSASR